MEELITISGSEITSSYINLEENLWILGTINGIIIKINRDVQENSYNHQIIYSSNSEVRSINKLSETEIILLFKTGEITILTSEDDQDFEFTIIEQGYDTRYSRSYRLMLYDDNEFFITKNYGKIIHYWRTDNNEWDSDYINIKHERNAIFCFGKIDENTFLTSDWNGILNIWGYKDGNVNKFQTIYTKGNMQKISTNPESSKLVIINRSGNFYYYERKEEESEFKYREIFENIYPEGRGKAVSFLNEEDVIYIGTSSKLYKFDLNEDILYYTNQRINCVDIYPFSDSDFILITTNTIYKVEKSSIDQTDEDLESYDILKVGLIGHTGVGKSSLCNFILHGLKHQKDQNIEPTFYKQIWFWNNPTGEGSKKIIFHDVAGQQELISSHIPQIIDSDVILALFKSTDTDTFNKLKDFIELIRLYYNYEKPIILVKTFKDKSLDLLDEVIINDFIMQYGIESYVSTTIFEENGADDLKILLLKEDLWKDSYRLILSFTSASFLELFDEIFYEEISLITIDELQALMEHPASDSRLVDRLKSKGKKGFTKSNLLFVLRKYSEMRLIDFDRKNEILIFNNLIFNNLRVSIPIFAQNKGGIVTIDEIKKRFLKSEQVLRQKYPDNETQNRITKELPFLETYIELIDNEFIDSRICIERNALRIFWPYLSDDSIDIPEHIEKFIFEDEYNEKGSLNFKNKRLKLRNLNDRDFIEELIDLKLNILALRKNEGLFENREKNGYLYYHYSERREQGKFIYEFNYYIYSIDKVRNYIIERGILNFFKRFEEQNIQKLKSKAINRNSNEQKVILICVSSPYGPRHIMADKDPKLIREIIKIYGKEKYVLEEISHITYDKLDRRIKEKPIPFIFQFSGHGKYSESAEPFLLLEDKEGEKELIGKDDFCECLKDFNSALNLIFFNACESYEFAEEYNAIYGTSSIGIRNDISDKSAYKFVEGFYVGIIKYGLNFQNSVEFGIDFVKKIKYDDLTPFINFIQ